MSAGPFATAVHALATPEEVEAFLKDTLGNRIEALEAAGVEVTLTQEHILGAIRIDVGRYRIVKLDGTAQAPEF